MNPSPVPAPVYTAEQLARNLHTYEPTRGKRGGCDICEKPKAHPYHRAEVRP